MRKYTNNIYVSGREEQSEIAESGKATLIKDLLPDIGPLGGIYSALKTIDQEKFLFIAVDMPF